MSAATAVKPLRRRTLERTGMTPEQELELLIAEQQTDDTFFVRRPAGEISLEGPAPGGLDGTVSDFIGVEYDFNGFDPEASGEIVSFLPREEESLFSVGLIHGSRSTYKNRGCRCVPCKAANAAWVRQSRSA